MADPIQESLTLPVLGMSCAACQHHVETALLESEGVLSAHVNLMAHQATIAFDSEHTSPEKLVEAIRASGYDAVLPRPGEVLHTADSDENNALLKICATLFGGVAAMLLSMPLSPATQMGWLDHRLMETLPALWSLPAGLLRWTLLLVTAALLLWAVRPIYLSAVRALRHGATNMNTLVTLGTGVAFLYSTYATLLPASDRAVYFDAVLMIPGFLLLGKHLESRAKRRAMSALNALSHLRPATARRIVNGQQTIVPLEQIVVGDSVQILPGERFPVDATILEGRTAVDESMLTGESTPLERTPGGRVLAGSLNYDGAVLCRAESLGEATVLEQIARLAAQAQSSRAPMERLADRASSFFVPTVLLLALLTFFVWLPHSLPMALSNMVAVLVIACPCAMGLAVPAALTVAVGRGAQLGVLFKGGEALERLAHLDVLVLDKTGTLTVGRPILHSIHPLAGFSDEKILQLAASAEEHSNHPLAHAIVDAAKNRAVSWATAAEVQVLPGRGLSAKVDDHEILLGNEALFRESFLALPKDTPAADSGVTRLWMALDGTVAGYFDAQDALRSDAPQAVTDLRHLGLRVLMLTGDSAGAAAPIARQAGIEEVEAGMDPAGKLARIRALQQQGLRVAMAGDGINDAAALAQSDAGFAMGGGADLAQEAGDVLLLHPHPGAIPSAIALSRATLRIMRQNLLWAAGYNLLGIPLAAGVFYPHFHLLLTPWIASAAMAFSSVSVLGNSLRLRGWKQ